MASGLAPPLSILTSVARVFGSATTTRFSRPADTNTLPAATTMPCTPGVSAIRPTIWLVSLSMTTTSVPCET